MRICGTAPRLLHALYRAPLGVQIPDSWESTLMTTKTLQLSIWPLPLRWTSANTPIHPFCLSFTLKVRVTTTSYLKFYLSNFFSDLGGSLGLWLGVGILQVFLPFSKLCEYWSCLYNHSYAGFWDCVHLSASSSVKSVWQKLKKHKMIHLKNWTGEDSLNSCLLF